MSIWDRHTDATLLFSGQVPSTVILDVETCLLYNAYHHLNQRTTCKDLLAAHCTGGAA
jgi:hypothetical protein